MTGLRFKFFTLMILVIGMTIISCSKEATVEEVENYVDQSIFGMEKDANAGGLGCFEFVFPIDIVFSDGTTNSVDSYDALKDAIKAWKEDNPDSDQRPTLGFPLDVMTGDGEIITVDDKTDLKKLRRDCIGAHDVRPWDRPRRFCFRPVFPLTIEFADGTTVEVETRKELRQLIREWKHENPTVDVRPHLVFPIEVEFRNGTVVTVESKEKLKALKEECRG